MGVRAFGVYEAGFRVQGFGVYGFLGLGVCAYVISVYS